MNEARNRWTWTHGALLLIQVFALYWLARLTAFDHGFPLDDAWIHQVVGRTFAETGVLGYTPERPGSAATSLLWAAVVGLNHAFFRLEPALFAFLVNAALFIMSGQLWLGMLHRDGTPLVVAFGCAAFAATASNFVWFALSGMESMLFVLLSTLAIWLWTEPGPRSRLRAWGCGLCLGLLFLTRPETGALFLVLVLVRPWTTRSWRDVARATIPYVATLLAYAMIMVSATGDIRPATLEGRRVLWFQDFAEASRVELIQRMLMLWAERLAEHTLALSTSGVLFWLILVLGAVGTFVVLSRRWVRFGSLVLWGAVHVLVYMALLPIPGHGGRYQPLTPALFYGLAWVGLWTVASYVRSRRTRPTGVRLVGSIALVVLMAVPTARSLTAWAHAHRDAVEHIWNTEVAMGRVVAELPPHTRVATFDIGGIGYFAQRKMLDLGGLVDPSLVEILRDSKAWPFLTSHGADYVVVPEGYAHEKAGPWNFFVRLGLDEAPAKRLVLTKRFVTPERVWKRGIEATLHAAPVQALYRIEHSDF